MARQQRQMGAGVRRPRLHAQARLSAAWKPVIRGWAPTAQRSVVTSRSRRWTNSGANHSGRGAGFAIRPRVCNGAPRRTGGAPTGSGTSGREPVGNAGGVPRETPMPRHGKVHGRRRPSEGEAGYGGRRRAHHPGVSTRVARLLKRPDGRGTACGAAFNAGDVLEVDHRMPRTQGGREAATNWPR